LFLVLIAATAAASAGQTARRAREAPLPAVSYTCPMDPDIVEDKPGACPRCRMTLVPIRLDTAYGCPVHTNEISAAPGACRIDHRALVPVTVSVYFTCAADQNVHELGPGACADGSPRIIARERRAHGDHNPRHGGEFFMASDNYHHLEGTYPRAGVFRLYFYDDFTRPLPQEKIRAFSGRAVTREKFDPATDTTTELEAVPLVMSKGGRYLEARVAQTLPAQITAKVKFAPGGDEHRFDFSFQALTTEPKSVGPLSTTTTPTAAKAQYEVSTTTAADENGLLSEIEDGRKQVEAAVQNAAFGEIYLSALATKDAALKLDALASSQSSERSARVSAAVREIVLAAWMLDQYGDLGDRRKIEQAYERFAAAVAALRHAYGR
jgi:hypothetical protein